MHRKSLFLQHHVFVVSNSKLECHTWKSTYDSHGFPHPISKVASHQQWPCAISDGNHWSNYQKHILNTYFEITIKLHHYPNEKDHPPKKMKESLIIRGHSYIRRRMRRIYDPKFKKTWKMKLMIEPKNI